MTASEIADLHREVARLSEAFDRVQSGLDVLEDLVERLKIAVRDATDWEHATS